MAKEKSEGTTRTLTVDQKRIEDWINNHEDQNEFFNALGVLTDEELAAAKATDEKFRLAIEMDPELAKQRAEEADQTGVINEQV